MQTNTTAAKLVQEFEKLQSTMEILATAVNDLKTEMAVVKMQFKVIIGLYVTLVAPLTISAIIMIFTKLLGS